MPFKNIAEGTDYIAKSKEALAKVRDLLMGGRAPSSEPSPPPRILIVEDNEDDRARYEVDFRRSEFQLTFARSAEEAFGIIAPDKFDLILVDLALPREDGTSVLRRIKSVANRTGVAVASGLFPPEHTESFLSISKPVTPEKLLDVVEKSRAIISGKQKSSS